MMYFNVSDLEQEFLSGLKSASIQTHAFVQIGSMISDIMEM